MSTFEDLGLNPMILEALQEIGFKTPTPIQQKAIPHLINSDMDLIALAQTGTGKTAAFSLPLIHKLDKDTNTVQAIVLCPTRELAIQVAKDINNFLKYTPGFKAMAVYGGERIDKQIKSLKNKPQIVVGTPGRTNDLIRRSVLKVSSVKWLVLDEADEMLNMGFKEELDEILETMPEEKQTLLFSATMDKPVRRIASNYMVKPEEITVGEKNSGSDNVQHFYYVVHERDRYQALRRIADATPNIHGIVFCRTRRETQLVADKLIQDNYSAEAIHGEISQDQRTKVMNRFRNKKTQILVATDVAARGIDVKELTHVINYNLPESTEAYVHRSGRTGRAHHLGISLVIINMREHYRINALERKIGKKFEKGRIPTGEDICEKQLFSLIDKVCNIEVNEKQISKYIEVINKKFEKMDRDELIKKLVSVEFNRFIEHYQGAVDLNASGGSAKPAILCAQIKINIGKHNDLNVRDLLDFLNNNKDLKGVEVGNIDIQNNHTIFEIDQTVKDKVLAYLNNAVLNNEIVQATCQATDIKSTRAPKKRSRSRGNYGGGRRSSGGYRGGGGRSSGGYRGGRSRRRR